MWIMFLSQTAVNTVQGWEIMVLTENRTKSRSISFRLPDEIVEHLETESTVKNVDIDTVLAEVCRNYFGYEGNAGKAGIVGFPRPLLIRLMDEFPEEKIIEMAGQMSKDVTTDMMAVLKNDYTVDSFIGFIQSWTFASRIPFRRQLKGNLNTIVIQPELGKKWSLYLGHLFKDVIEELAGRKVKINVTDKSVMFMF